ncbi:MAG: phage tail protein [Oceanospirillaceae bacterium]
MPEFIPFRFKVSLFNVTDDAAKALVAQGAFSDISGLEISMSAKTIKEGGRNWGDVQLAGKTTFPTLVLKRGITDIDDLYAWIDISTRQANYAYRMQGLIEVFDQNFSNSTSSAQPILSWHIENAMAVKFKSADLSANASAVAIEELHLVHEGLQLTRRKPQGAA